MKYLIAVLLTVSVVFGQNKVGEQDAIKRSHIDLKKEYVYFSINGWVEVDGHTFCNDTTSNPFIFQADLDGVKLYRKNEPQTLYTRRNCSHKDCNVLHFEQKKAEINPMFFRNNYPITY